jgi:hypothetical protein
MADTKIVILHLDSFADSYHSHATRLLAGFSSAKIDVVLDGLSFAFKAAVSPVNEKPLSDTLKSYIANGFLPQTTTLRFCA